MNRHALQVVAAAVSSGIAASAVTWYLTKKAYEELYEKRLAEEVQASIEFLKAQDIDLSKVDVVPGDIPEDPELAEQPQQVLEDGFDTEPLPDVEGERIVSPIFSEKPPLEELATHRTRYDKILTEEEYKETAPEAPPEDPNIVVISQDLYLSGVSEYPQSVLTVFADGGVLDEAGSFVAAHTDLIGVGPYPFGEMSEDDSVVYIRNKKLEREFEVIKDDQNAADFLSPDLPGGED